MAQNIASTGNPGNLRTPLKTLQVLGVWLWGTYKHPPTGLDLAATDALIAVTIAAVLLGVVRVIHMRDGAITEIREASAESHPRHTIAPAR